MIRLNLLDQYMDICNDALLKCGAKIRNSFKTCLMEVLVLYMVIPGRINFLQLGRYGNSCEQRFRQHFSKSFNWLGFNVALSSAVLTGSRKAIAIDPSYISKSGKCTPWVGYFWSGCAGSTKRGLEVLGIGVIDVDRHDCFHLQAVQTPDTKTLEKASLNLLDWYLLGLEVHQFELLKVSQYMVADAYFSKRPFVDGVLNMGFHLISRFRDDAVLHYPIEQPIINKRGRPKKYGEKINFKNLDLSTVEELDIDEGKLYTLVAYSKSLHRKVRLAIWYSADGKEHKLYFCTDDKMSGKDVIEYYRTRFQLEFVFRNAKGFAGLNHSQSRCLDRIHFHFNASLTTVNLAKVLAAQKGIPFSMASLKTMMHNTFLLERFIRVSGIKPNKQINQKLWEEAIRYSIVAA